MVPAGAKPSIFMNFSWKRTGACGKYRWNNNLSFVVHGNKSLVLKNFGTLVKSLLKWIE
jgi:hypothetical protein